jgi:hypothetical protein
MFRANGSARRTLSRRHHGRESTPYSVNRNLHSFDIATPYLLGDLLRKHVCSLIPYRFGSRHRITGKAPIYALSHIRRKSYMRPLRKLRVLLGSSFPHGKVPEIHGIC